MSTSVSNNPANKKLGTTTINKPAARKPPVIRQTLTSIYRTLKANPLLLTDNTKYNQSRDFDVSKVKIPNTIKPTPTIPEKKEPPSTKTVKQPFSNRFPQKPETFFNRKSSVINAATRNKIADNKLNKNVEAVPHKKVNHALKTASITNSVKIKRRSLSADHFDKKKIGNPINQQQINGLSKSKATSVFIIPDVSPIVEKNVKPRVTFKATLQDRRSVSVTPRKSLYTTMASTPKPIHTDLQQRLEKWLQRHKKPVEKYHHLKCFGFKNLKPKIDDYDDDNKENIEIECASRSSSYEDLRIPEKKCEETPITYSCNNNNNDADIRHLARGALKDLHSLITDGYCSEQCEAWLEMIKGKYNGLEEESQYWECRAAIEQMRGDLTSAVDCLRTAIVRGAEVTTVDESLEQLLQKFSILNIDEHCKNDHSKKDRNKILCDARNIFKSTIIQFAIQERTLKKNQLQEQALEKKFVATPVRRSTRRRTLHVSTPSIKLCSTLQELEPDLRDKISFEKNGALSVK